MRLPSERRTRHFPRNPKPGYLSAFTGVPAYPTGAGVNKDDRIDRALTEVIPQPYDGSGATKAFWSQHEGWE